MVRIQFSIQLAYDVAPPGADFIFNLHCAHTRHQTLLTEQLQLNQAVASTLFVDPATFVQPHRRTHRQLRLG